MRRTVIGWLGAMVLLAGCEEDPTAEARIFLDRVEAIDTDAPLPERRRLLNNLAHLPLSHEKVRRARTLCVDAHGAILEAEEVQDRVQREVAEHETEAAIPADTRAELDRDLRRAARAILRARSLLARCEEERRGLYLRYGRRRT